MARWQYNFNSGTFASGKTRMAPKVNKFTTAWWLASKGKNMPVAMKCQINNQLKPDLPQQKPGSCWENRSLPTTSQLHCMISTWVAVPKSRFLRCCLCCRDVGPYGPNNKHSLEEHWWHVGSATSTVAPLRVARLEPVPRQTNIPLHDGWRQTWQMCHCSWKVKSTIRKAELS